MILFASSLVALQLAVAAAAAPAPAGAPVAPGHAAASVRPEAAAAAAAVDAFHAALRRGDTKGALAYLAEDVLIFEEGGAERSKAEYASHHLGADAAFAKAVPAVRTRRTGWASGPLAWIASESRVSGEFRGSPVNRTMVETMVLRRVGRGWQIVHIHWSSGGPRGS
jgi:ketosteroid isomerase-like protein